MTELKNFPIDRLGEIIAVNKLMPIDLAIKSGADNGVINRLLGYAALPDDNAVEHMNEAEVEAEVEKIEVALKKYVQENKKSNLDYVMRLYGVRNTELAEIMGCDDTYISRWRAGKNMSRKYAIKAAKALVRIAFPELENIDEEYTRYIDPNFLMGKTTAINDVESRENFGLDTYMLYIMLYLLLLRMGYVFKFYLKGQTNPDKTFCFTLECPLFELSQSMFDYEEITDWDYVEVYNLKDEDDVRCFSGSEFRNLMVGIWDYTEVSIPNIFRIASSYKEIIPFYDDDNDDDKTPSE